MVVLPGTPLGRRAAENRTAPAPSWMTEELLVGYTADSAARGQLDRIRRGQRADDLDMISTVSPITVPFADLSRQHVPLAGELRAAFDRVLDSNAFTLGEEVDRFEREFAEYCG